MTDLFTVAEQCLCSPDIETKLSITREAWRLSVEGELSFESDSEPLPIAAVRFPDRPILVEPRELPKRKLNSPEGRVALLHAVAHIEFTAIQLAWDHLYRFRGLPVEYYRDWLGVAHEEAEHFGMICLRLRQLGSDYGELPAHAGLWSIAAETAHDLAARMALVPRFMEARGLDVTPGMIQKLTQAGDPESVAILTRILEDEVGHVALGSRWFLRVCEGRGSAPEEEYFALIDRHLRGQARGPFNFDLRRKAGFSETELNRLEALS
jgi:uncharacterized ferritin-like protein (DUF455 family)